MRLTIISILMLIVVLSFANSTSVVEKQLSPGVATHTEHVITGNPSLATR